MFTLCIVSVCRYLTINIVFVCSTGGQKDGFKEVWFPQYFLEKNGFTIWKVLTWALSQSFLKLFSCEKRIE